MTSIPVQSHRTAFTTPMFRRNVLIFHSGALGDFVLTWPLALALARLYPQSRVYYVTPSGKGKLAEAALRVESSDLDTGGWHQLFVDNAELPAPAQKLLASSHTVVSFLSSGNDTWAQNARRITGPDATLVFLTPPTRAVLPQPGFETEHASDFILRQLAPHPALAEATRQILRSINERGLSARPASTDGVIIHPGSGGEDKCWPVERYAELATRLIAAGRKVTFIVGEAELERWPKEEPLALEAVAPTTRLHQLDVLLRILQTAAQFIGNDSGPAHLAGILGVPTLAIFGPTDPANWKPLGPSVSVVSGELSGIPVDHILAALKLET